MKVQEEKNKEVLKALFNVQIKSIDEANHTIDAVFSTPTPDRVGDVMVPEGYVLDAFKTHPVLVNNHDSSNVLNILGNIDASITKEGLAGKVHYLYGAGNPAADWAFILAKNGLAAFSVSFRGLEYEPILETDEDGVQHTTGYRWTKAELLEISQVVLPCNPEALGKSLKEFSNSQVANAPKPATKQCAGSELVAEFAKIYNKGK